MRHPCARQTASHHTALFAAADRGVKVGVLGSEASRRAAAWSPRSGAAGSACGRRLDLADLPFEREAVDADERHRRLHARRGHPFGERRVSVHELVDVASRRRGVESRRRGVPESQAEAEVEGPRPRVDHSPFHARLLAILSPLRLTRSLRSSDRSHQSAWPHRSGQGFRCGGRLRFVAAINDPDVIRRILGHLGSPQRPARRCPRALRPVRESTTRSGVP